MVARSGTGGERAAGTLVQSRATRVRWSKLLPLTDRAFDELDKPPILEPLAMVVWSV